MSPTPTMAIGIVGHTKRGERAQQLADQVSAEVVGMDLGTLGAAANHRACWEWLAESNPDWGIVLEDDALPVKTFRPCARLALASSPAGIVSFYMGRNRPPHWQDSYSQAIAAQKHYALAPELLHAVGYAVHRDLIPAVLDVTAKTKHFNEAVSDWCRKSGQMVAYTVPSLVDHDYRMESLIADQPTRYDETAPGSVPRSFTPKGWERRAWVAGERLDWDRTSVMAMPEPGKRAIPVSYRADCGDCRRHYIGSYRECENWADIHVGEAPRHMVSVARRARVR